jgi:hypothetical protein
MLASEFRRFKPPAAGLTRHGFVSFSRQAVYMQKVLSGALIMAGGAFCVTAMLFCVMMVRADRAVRDPSANVGGSGLDRLINEYGQTALIVELVVLGMIVALVIWRGDKK